MLKKRSEARERNRAHVRPQTPIHYIVQEEWFDGDEYHEQQHSVEVQQLLQQQHGTKNASTADGAEEYSQSGTGRSSSGGNRGQEREVVENGKLLETSECSWPILQRIFGAESPQMEQLQSHSVSQLGDTSSSKKQTVKSSDMQVAPGSDLTTTTPLLRSDIRWGSEKQASPSNDLYTSLTMSSRGRWSDEEASLGGRCDPESFAGTAVRPFLDRAMEPSEADAGDEVLDAHYLERCHGGSSEAVMLAVEPDRVLWVNSAFKRLNNEMMSSVMQEIGPHIDPLGIRVHLATLTFQLPFPAFKCKALLWSYLKKSIMQEGGAHKSSGLPEAQAKVPSPPAKVIAPQPLRAVESTVTVQSIVTVDPHAAPLTDGFESIQESLDKGDMSSVITDLKFRVRWVNTAYMRLVGQPKCSWLASTVGGSAEEDSPVSLQLAGDVSLVCDASQLPVGIAAFSCRVGIQWNPQGEHSSMFVPSEVVRLDDGILGSLYAWGFDL